MPEIEVKAEIELYCDTCGDGICGNGTATHTRHHPCFRIEACQKCMKDARRDGYDEGYEVGYEAGYAAAEAKFNEGK